MALQGVVFSVLSNNRVIFLSAYFSFSDQPARLFVRGSHLISVLCSGGKSSAEHRRNISSNELTVRERPYIVAVMMHPSSFR